MLDKYFGFLKMHDQYSVIESFLEHCRIDEEELKLLSQMIDFLCCDEMEKVEEFYFKIRKISMDSSRMFEHTGEQIIQANFDHQKQYDLLRLFQKIEDLSGLIIATAKRVLILHRIGSCLPKELNNDLKELMVQVLQIHAKFRECLNKYIEDKKGVIEIVEQIEELEHNIDHQRSLCLETLYKLGNRGGIPLGMFRAIENIIEHLEDISDAIQVAAASLEWLLIY